MKQIAALLISILIITMSFNVSAPSPNASTNANFSEDGVQDGQEEGVSWKPVMPIKNAIFVNYDGESYLDDYAYLASVPAAVFYSDSNDMIYSSPLIFYQKPEDLIDEEKVLNAASGVDYFMEDWLTYADGTLDNVQFINIPSEDVNGLSGKWSANDYNIIQKDCPIKIAKDIALYNWEYSDSAVIAVIDENYEEIDDITTSEVNGTISGSTPIRVDVIEGEKEPDPVEPTFHGFSIQSDYKYITSYMEWYGP
ncbi:MAG: hypothetical protein JSV09_15135, partial [Thermoplasmata archaeon]